MCPIVFQGHLSNFKVTLDKKWTILTRIERFWTVTPVWIHQWLWNDAQSLTWYRRIVLLFFKVIHQISRSQGQKIAVFYPNWVFPDCNSSLNSPMVLKWCTKLKVIEEVPYCFPRSSTKFQGHAGQKSPNLTWIERFQTVTPVWIHRWIWNDAQSLM